MEGHSLGLSTGEKASSAKVLVGSSSSLHGNVMSAKARANSLQILERIAND
jgi:hypothetical protein